MAETKTHYMIIDDEPIAHRIIEDYCEALPHLELVKNCYNALEALQYLNSHRVDLIFLDINMPKLKGFDFLRTLANPPQVIVTTAYAEFALEGFELNVCDYLLKPFALPRFLTAVNKAMAAISQRSQVAKQATITPTISPSNEPKSDVSMFIKGDKKHHQVYLNDISHIEACGNYCLVFVDGRKLMTHEKISIFEAKLPKEQFIRVHKSFIVSKAHIDAISANCLHIGAKTIPIGQKHKEAVRELIA